jgi:hypothetical protein
VFFDFQSLKCYLCQVECDVVLRFSLEIKIRLNMTKFIKGNEEFHSAESQKQ